MTGSELRAVLRRKHEIAVRRSNRVAYYYMARGHYGVGRDFRSWRSLVRALRCLAWFVFLTLATWIARRELGWLPPSLWRRHAAR